jgi:hypothetical protein
VWAFVFRFATLVMLSFQLIVLAAGSMPVRDACCCVAKGKACKCKSHAPKHASPDEGPCVSAARCGGAVDFTFTVMEWVTLPELETASVSLATAELAPWPASTAGSVRGERPEAPPPKVS